MKYSVVIPCYNSSKYLTRALESVCSQSLAPSQIIVIDDGSSKDESLSHQLIANRYGAEYYYKINGGAASARNYGVAKCTNEWIGLLDVDDEWKVSKMETQFNSLNSPMDEVCIISDVSVYSDGVKRFDQLKKLPSNDVEIIKSILLGGLTMCTPTMVFRKSLFDDVGGFDESLELREDHEFLIKIVNRCAGIKIISEPLVIRNETTNSLSNSFSNAKYIKAQIAFFKKCLTLNKVRFLWVWPFIFYVFLSSLKVTLRRMY